MRDIRWISIFAACVILVPFNTAVACIARAPGIGLGADELIAQANLIVMARVVSIKNTPVFNLYKFEVIEVLKGEATEQIVHAGIKHIPQSGAKGLGHDYDFENHNEKEFWASDMGRTYDVWGQSLCGRQTYFTENQTYLIFPDKFGALKSGEIIRSEDDKWLQYVRDRI